MTWKELLIGVPLAILGALLVLVTAGSLVLTRTDWGRAHLREFALERLNPRIRGRIEIDGVAGGDLFRNVSVAGVRLYDPAGDTVASADTVRVDYRWWDLIAGDIALSGVRLVNPRFELVRSEQGRWNLEQVFAASSPDTTGATAAGRRPRVVLEHVEIHHGSVSVALPAEAPSEKTDTATIGLQPRLEQVDGAWRRVFDIRDLDATIPVARVVAPATVERLVRIQEMRGRFEIFQQPIDVQDARADLEWQGDTLSFDLWQLALPNSRFFGKGRLAFGEVSEYDVSLRADPVSAADLTWLEPRLPSDGHGSLDLRIRTEAGDLDIDASNATWQSREAEVSGRLGLRIGGKTRVSFDSLRLSIEHLQTSLIDRLSPWKAPLPGQLSGRVAADGNRSALTVDTDLRFRPSEDTASAHVEAIGTVLAEPDRLGARDLRVSLDTVPFSLIRALGGTVALRGIVAGKLRADGRLANGMAVEFDLQQRDPDVTGSRVQGAGRLTHDSAGAFRVNLETRVAPLSLTGLATYYPGIPIRGDFTGTVRARGPLRNLHVEAFLGGAGDSLMLSGQIAAQEKPIRYQGQLSGRRVKLARFREGLPPSDLDFHIAVQGEGTDLPALRGHAHVDLLSSFVGGVRLDSSYADMDVRDGQLRVDTLVLNGEFGQLSSGGTLGLATGTTGTLTFDLAADSLGGLNPWLFPAQEPVAGPTVTDGAMQGLDAGTRRFGIEGEARVLGRVVGRLGDASLVVNARGSRLLYGDWRADSVQVTELSLSGLADTVRVEGALRGVGISTDALGLAEANLSGRYIGGLATVSVALRATGDASATGELGIRLGSAGTDLEVRSLDLQFGTSRWRLTESGSVHLAKSGALDVEHLVLTSAAGRLEAGGSIGVSGPIAFHVMLSGLDLAELAKAVPKDLGVAGTIKVDLRVSGRTRAPVMDGSVEVADGRLLGISFTSFGGMGQYEGGEATIDVAMQRESNRLFRLQGTLPMDAELPRFSLKFPERAIRLTFDGDSIPLSLAYVLTGDQLQDIRGYAQGEILIRGSPKEVSLVGKASLSGGAFRVPSTGIRYQGVAGQLLFRGNQIELDSVALKGSRSGEGRVSGTVDVSKVNNPGFDLELRANQLPAYNRPDGHFAVSGTARLTGPYNGASFTGKLSVVRGVLYIEEINRRSEVIDLSIQDFQMIDTVFGLQAEAGQQSGNVFMDNLTVDLNLTVERNNWLRSEDTNVEIAGNLQVQMQRAQQSLRVFGTLNAVRGDYKFLNRRFEVVEGTLEFVGTQGINPNLHIVAETRVPSQKRPIVIQAILGGTLDDPKLNLTSDAQPPINESDLVSYLLFGRPSYQITRGGPGNGNLVGNLAASLPQAFFGYALESLLVGEAGIDYVDVTRAQTAGASGVYGSGLTPALAATQVEVGWYIAPQIFVSIAQQLAGTVGPAVRLEWRLTENFTIQGVTEPRLTSEAGLAEATTALERRSIGLFLFYGWTY